MFLSQLSVVPAQYIVAVDLAVFPSLRPITVVNAIEVILFPCMLTIVEVRTKGVDPEWVYHQLKNLITE